MCDKKEVNNINIVKTVKLRNQITNIVEACCKIALLEFFDINRNLTILESEDKTETIAETETKSQLDILFDYLSATIQTLVLTV